MRSSPELFTSEETEDIDKLLEANNYTVTRLLGKKATVKQLTNYGSHFPYDVMHTCAHGGEVDGYFVVQEFTDRDGKPHKLEFYEVVGFSPTEGDMVSVHRKLIFKSFDGFPWMSPPLKSYPHYVFEDMMVATRLEPESRVLRVPFKSKIALSCHIQCADSIHQGEFHGLAGFGHPFVFNNTGSSSHEIASMIIRAGARSYVGTRSVSPDNLAALALPNADPERARGGHRQFPSINHSLPHTQAQTPESMASGANQKQQGRLP